MDLSVNQLTLTELHQEIQRRVNRLLAERTELRARLVEIDRDLAAIGGERTAGAGTPGPARRGGRRGGQPSLREVLARILHEQPRTTAEAADAAVAAGYKTESKNFRNSVSVVLNREDCFFKKDNRWYVIEGAVTELAAGADAAGDGGDVSDEDAGEDVPEVEILGAPRPSIRV
jgi:hypothetical protein